MLTMSEFDAVREVLEAAAARIEAKIEEADKNQATRVHKEDALGWLVAVLRVHDALLECPLDVSTHAENVVTS